MHRVIALTILSTAFGVGILIFSNPAGALWPQTGSNNQRSVGHRSLAEEMVVEVKKTISATMLDPDSAKFRNLAYIDKLEYTDGRTPTHVVCGEVNGKNRFGGYTGFTPFFYDAGQDYPRTLKGMVCDGDLREACLVLYDGICTRNLNKMPMPR